ncbi:hypothetical protein BGX28_003243 [Mortierella sp. GBA30]|nr:hypothetical protein BGX28_003243 [Mortierella sp. GBA30]
MAWSVVTCFIVLISSLSFLSPSTSGGRALAALTPGFCGDCQTFVSVIGECGGTFGPADIEINGEYAIQQPYSKCICKDVIQKLLWNCAKCELLAGHQSKAPPPQKYRMQCITWGMTPAEWLAPYTGPVAPGTQADLGGGPNPPAPSNPATSSNPKPTGGTATTDNGGSKPSSSSDPNSPSASSDNSVSPEDKTGSGSGSGLNTTAIGISVGIIGVAAIAGVAAVVMMKTRRRRRRASFDTTALSHMRSPSPPPHVASSELHARDYPAAPASVIGAHDRYGHRQVIGYEEPERYNNGSGNGSFAPMGRGQQYYPQDEYQHYHAHEEYQQYHPHDGFQQTQYPSQHYDYESKHPSRVPYQ